MSEPLKPCPFCGGEAKLVGDYYPNVVCQSCCASTGDVGQRTPETVAKSIAAWNRRAEPTAYRNPFGATTSEYNMLTQAEIEGLLADIGTIPAASAAQDERGD